MSKQGTARETKGLDRDRYSQVQFVQVTEHETGQRLDNFLLKRLKGVPKSKIYQIVRKGEVRIDKKRAKPATKLIDGQEVRIPPIRLSQGEGEEVAGKARLDKNQRQIADIEKAIIYEDKHLLVLNKPSGLAVHGGSGVSLGLIELIRAGRPEGSFLELVHRLDRETSGCIVIAKRGAILRELHGLIRDSKIDKFYVALVDGRWKGARHLVEAPLLKTHLKSGERIVRVSREGKESKTVFLVKERFQRCSLVEAELLTGRTHQIRVHCQYSGHSILGDEKYGQQISKELLSELGLKRMFLHARRLVLPLSCYDQPLAIEAPLDAQLTASLKRLRKGAAG